MKLAPNEKASTLRALAASYIDVLVISTLVYVIETFAGTTRLHWMLTIHSFKYGHDGGEMLEVTGARSGAVQMFSDLSAEIPAGPPDVQKIVDVMARNGATVHL